MHKKRMDFCMGRDKSIVKIYKNYKKRQKLLINFSEYAII